LKNGKRGLGDDDLREENLETLVDFEDLIETGVELSVDDVLPELPAFAKRDLGDLDIALGDGVPQLPTIGAGDTSAAAAGSLVAPFALLVLLRNLIPGGAGRVHPRQFR
jgi:hypothetical protein